MTREGAVEVNAATGKKKRISKRIRDADFAKTEAPQPPVYELAKGLEHLKEGGERCFKCYALRLEETARMAKEAEFDYFTTTLTISPMKNAEKLNTIGAKIGEKYGVKYLQSDFKKKNGYKRSIELSNEFGLYRQDYCGCEFSVRDRKQESTGIKKK